MSNMTATEVIDRSLAKYGLQTTLSMYAINAEEEQKKEMKEFIEER